jgi:hypothetical protein
VACTLDAQGQKLHEARIDGNVPAAFAAYFKKLGTPSEVVVEAGWNWACSTTCSAAISMKTYANAP